MLILLQNVNHTFKTTTKQLIYLLKLIRPPKMEPLSNASFHLNGICNSCAGILVSKAQS